MRLGCVQLAARWRVAGLLALLTLALGPASASAFPQYNSTFDDNFNGTAFPKNDPTYPGAWGIPVLVDGEDAYLKQVPGTNGSTVAEARLTKGTRAELNCYRVDAPLKCGAKEGDELYYEFDMRVPSGQTLPDFPGEAGILQTKPAALTNCDGYGGSMNINDGSSPSTYRLKLRVRARGLRDIDGDGNKECDVAYDRTFDTIGDVSRDAWHHIGLHVKYSHDSSIGFVEVEVDGQTRLPRTAVQNHYGDGTNMHFRLGLYTGDKIPATPVTVQYDNFRVGPAVPVATSPGCYAKEGSLTANWVDLGTPACAEIRLGGSRLAVRDADRCLAKDGALTAGWVVQVSSGCAQVAASPNRIGVRTTGDTCLAKEGSLLADWIQQLGPGGCAATTVKDTRVGVTTADARCLAKEGALSAPWVTEIDPGCAQIQVSANRVGVVGTRGSCVAKEGSLFANWVEEWATGCAQIAVSDTQVAVRTTDGRCLVKEGGLTANWVEQIASGCAQVAVATDRVAVRTTAGACAVKEGPLTGTLWVEQAGANCAQIAVTGTRVGIVRR
jgi:hypothetical protein